MLPQFDKNEILQHLTALENDFSRYFSELSNELDLVRNPFNLSNDKAHADCQDEFPELKTDSGARDMFHEKAVTESSSICAIPTRKWQKELSTHCFHLCQHIFVSQAFQLCCK